MKQHNDNNQKTTRFLCNTLPFLAGCLFCVISLKTVPAMATTPHVDTLQQTQNTIVQHTSTHDRLQSRAKRWGLTTTELQHYRWLMHNTPSGHWYQTLDPPEVLALNATTAEKMWQYAKIQARNTHARVTKELAFAKLYRKAYKTLYPHEKPIMSPNAKHLQGATLQKGDRIWLFIGTKTPLATFIYQHLIDIIQKTPDTVLDIYVVGPHVSQQVIAHWAAHIGIAPHIVNKEVTLNYGNRRFKQLTHGKTVSLPFIGIVHNNHFQPITLSSVL